MPGTTTAAAETAPLETADDIAGTIDDLLGPAPSDEGGEEGKLTDDDSAGSDLSHTDDDDDGDAGEAAADPDSTITQADMDRAVQRKQARIIKLRDENATLKAQLADKKSADSEQTDPDGEQDDEDDDESSSDGEQEGEEGEQAAVGEDVEPELAEADTRGPQLQKQLEYHQGWNTRANEWLARYEDEPDAVIAEIKAEAKATVDEAGLKNWLTRVEKRSDREVDRTQNRLDAHQDRMAERGAHLRTANRAKALKVYPWLADKKSPEFKEASELMASAPAELRQMPDALFHICDAVMGRRARKGIRTRTVPGKPKRAAKLPARLPGQPRAAQTAKVKGVNLDILQGKIAAGDEDARATLVESLL